MFEPSDISSDRLSSAAEMATPAKPQSPLRIISDVASVILEIRMRSFFFMARPQRQMIGATTSALNRHRIRLAPSVVGDY
jgi:hypothetical protein